MLAYGSELEVYGITAVFISQLIAKIDTLPELIESSRIALLRRKGATKVIEELESKLTEILRDQIDRIMLVFKTDHPAFVLDYQNARTRVGNGSSITAI